MPSALSFLNTTWSSNYYPIKVVVYAQVCSNFAVWQEELLFAQYYSIVVKSFGQFCSLLSSGKKVPPNFKEEKERVCTWSHCQSPLSPRPRLFLFRCVQAGSHWRNATVVTSDDANRRPPLSLPIPIPASLVHHLVAIKSSPVHLRTTTPLLRCVCVFALSSHIAFIYSVLTVPWLHISFSQAECEDLCSTRLNLFNSSLCIITVWYCNFYSRAFDSHYQQQNSFLFLRWI